jgi:hypothetical protein
MTATVLSRFFCNEEKPDPLPARSDGLDNVDGGPDPVDIAPARLWSKCG